MAEHADTPEQIAASAFSNEHSDVDEPDADEDAAQSTETPSRQGLSGLSGTRGLITVGLVMVAALAGLGGWLGYRVHQDRDAQAQRNLYVQVARQAAVNLTTINYTEVDSDIMRILDSATGTFHDDFQNRSQPFVDVVKKVQSRSEGTVAEAALLSDTKDQAQVLVAVSVKTSTAAGPEQEPRRWRMRISVDRAGDSVKVSNVEFVP
jgi:Mce-associated membrane protein